MNTFACSSCGDRPALRGHDLCAKCDDEALGDGYEPSDPKSIGYFDRMAERADHARKAERENR